MKISKVLAVSTAVACLFTTGVSAATVQKAQVKAQKTTISNNLKDNNRGMNRNGLRPKNFLGNLVTAGTITKAQLDAVEKAMKDARESNKTIKEALDSLVTAGTITQAQEDSILKVVPQNGKFGPGGEHKSPIESLVTAGTITQVQADAIEVAMKTGMESKKSIKDTIAGLVTADTITQVQADAVLKEFENGFKGHGDHMNPMDSLVKDGTITQAQLDAINAAVKSARESKKTPEEAIAALVTAGTITQAQADAISKYGFKGHGDHVNPMESLVKDGTITQAQLDAIGTAMKDARESNKTMKDAIAGLVTAGTITQAQADAILKVFPQNIGKCGPMGPHMNPMDSLVKDGTITQAQLDAIGTAMKDARESNKTMKDVLAGLVTAGTITQAQSDAISKIFPQNIGKGGPRGWHNATNRSSNVEGTKTVTSKK